jgi:DNA replication ATP-dependent helicase Dna2
LAEEIGANKGEGGAAVKKLGQGYGPRKGAVLFPPPGNAAKGKENRPLSQKQRTVEPNKTAKIGERAMLRGKPVLRDILNDMMDGGY